MKVKPLLSNIVPAISQKTDKTTHTAPSALSHTSLCEHKDGNNKKMQIKIQIGTGSAHLTSDLFCILPLTVSQSPPTLFQLSIRLHTQMHTLPQLLFSPSFFCHSKDPGHAGSTCQSKAGSAEEAASKAH